MYYVGFSYSEAMNLPIWQRQWFVKRVQEEFERSNGASKAAHDNTSEQRMLRGNNRSEVPANLRRFT